VSRRCGAEAGPIRERAVTPWAGMVGPQPCRTCLGTVALCMTRQPLEHAERPHRIATDARPAGVQTRSRRLGDHRVLRHGHAASLPVPQHDAA
jgi:hypothetical protein